MQDESASIVVVAGANCDGDNVGELLDEGLDFTRLFHSGFGPEQVEQITGDTDEVEVWSLFNQPPKPVNAIVQISGKKKLHWFREKLVLAVEMSSVVSRTDEQRRRFDAKNKHDSYNDPRTGDPMTLPSTCTASLRHCRVHKAIP